ncbi:hypothetical protein [Caballeronia sp. BR00000012568055]|uniref:hypothetical protein n=1 Tax=Caballeronia sp. BR00000012568055 TaxID=2918761 RepID=UPI0023F7C2EF|nr:hypothetical protein [Caballeronia sp. BR00000012568055]
MYRTFDSPALPHARHCVAFDLTVPGLDSSPARDMLGYAFGAGTHAYVTSTNRLHDCSTLYVETDSDDINDVIAVLTTHFPQATLGRVTRITRR